MTQYFPTITPVFPEAEWDLCAVLRHQAKARGDEIFLRWMPTGRTVSFAEADALSSSLARGLRRAGIGAGDRVALLLENSIEHVIVWFALAKIGAVDAPINTALLGDFLVHQMNLVKARFLIAEPALAQTAVDVSDRLLHLEQIIVRGKEPHPESRYQTSALDRLYLAGDTMEAPPGPSSLPATILFTSGTTGPSKGAVLSRAQFYFFTDQVIHVHQLTSADVILAPVPLFHVSGRVFGAYAALLAGCQYAMYEKFSATRFVDRLHESGATITHLIGGMMAMIFAQPPTPRDLGHRLRSVFCGPTAYAVEEEFKARFGVRQIMEGLGQTEVCQPVLTPPGVKRPFGSAGVLMKDWFEARIVDPETDEEVPDGTIGEYVVRSKRPWLITLGYENMPERTVEAMRNLWFHTGDAVMRDKDGWYYFKDRIKDCIRRRGENISSYEVETALERHPSVEEVAAIAVKAGGADPEDEILVCVTPAAGTSVRIGDLVDWMVARVPPFVVPRYYRVVETLPKTSNSKVKKAELRKEGITADTVDRLKL